MPRRVQLLYDPQTSGGLLAAVAPAAARPRAGRAGGGRCGSSGRWTCPEPASKVAVRLRGMV